MLCLTHLLNYRPSSRFLDLLIQANHWTKKIHTHFKTSVLKTSSWGFTVDTKTMNIRHCCTTNKSVLYWYEWQIWAERVTASTAPRSSQRSQCVFDSYTLSSHSEVCLGANLEISPRCRDKSRLINHKHQQRYREKSSWLDVKRVEVSIALWIDKLIISTDTWTKCLLHVGSELAN